MKLPLPFNTVFIKIKTAPLQKKIKWAVTILSLVWFWFSLPGKLFNAPTSFVISDKNGQLLNASIASDGQWRFPYSVDVPEKFAVCITNFEDKRFWYHPGIDPIAMLRAIKQNLSGNKIVSGGSTLTMQTIRLSKKNSKRNLWNKITESILALRLECSYRKKSILALYASNAPFGSNVVGLEAAAWRYYGRSANRLSWGEMAALAVLPNAPSLIHPGKNRGLLYKKRDYLLQKLLTEKEIDSTTFQLAKAEPLPGEPKALPQHAPHLLNRFKRDFIHQKNKQLPTLLQTTIDINLQQQVQQAVQLQYQQLKGNQINNIAAMVMEIETGNVLAYIGNINDPANTNIESHVDILSSVRSPGSTLKPLLYASLLTEGSLLPKQLIPDIPTQIGGYTPQNFDLGFDGAVPANKALARSLNIPAVKMLQQYKYQRFYDVLKQAGFSTLKQAADFYGMSLILGGCEVSPYELGGVYSSMARMYLHQKQNKQSWNNKDWHMPAYSLQTKKENPTNTAALFDYTSIWHMLNAMNEVMRPGEEGLWNFFNSSQRIAWKTGTSFGFRDAWSIGITPKYCVVVWAGNTTGEGRPLLTGIAAAAPLMFDIFRLLPKSPWFEPPMDKFTYTATCRKSGYKLSLDCEAADTILTGLNSTKTTPCIYCRSINLDLTGIYRVNASCENPSQMKKQKWFVLPPAIEYFYKLSHPDYAVLPPFKPGCANETSKLLDIIYPDEDALLYIPREISGQKGKIIFKATHRSADISLFWHLDNNYLVTTRQFHQISIQAEPGKHTITIIDPQGNSVQRTFTIADKDR